MSDAPPAGRLKPEKTPYLLGRLLGPSVAALALGLAGSVTAALTDQLSLLPFGALALLLFWGLSTAAAFVALGKERYAFYDRVIHCSQGGLLSDQSTELDVRNITHVKQHLPWLRYKLFGVGDILIESAGSAASEVRLRAVAEPDRVYAEVRELMKRNGFSLGQGRVLHQESPDLVGVIVELLGLFVSGVAALVFMLASLFDSDDGPAPAENLPEEIVTSVLVVGGNLAAVAALVFLALRFLDMRRRTYTVYDDAVVYEEGFLNRDNAFIPFENVADADTKRTLVDQILGLYDVRVSCQGGSSEVRFRRLRRGEELTRAVSALVDAARAKGPLKGAPSKASAELAGEPPGAEAAAGPRSPEAPGGGQLVAPEQAWTAELRMDMTRALLPALLLLVFPPAAIAAGVGVFLRAFATTYRVRPSSVKSEYRLLRVDEREFAYDKITGLVVRESVFDRWMRTVTVELWSIGSASPLELLHIKRSQVDLDALRRQVGIPAPSPQPYRCETLFSLRAWVLANLGGLAGSVLAAAGVVVAGLLSHPAVFGLLVVGAVFGLGHFVYRTFYFGAQRLAFHDDHLRAQTGRLVRRQYFVRYANVKKVQVTRYPGGALGRLTFFVAGERVPPYVNKAAQQQQGQARAGARVPYAFTAHYLDEAEAVAERVDGILLGTTAPGPDAPSPSWPAPVRSAQPAVANTVARTTLTLLVAFPLLPLLPFVLPWAIIAVKRRAYLAEPDRVVATWGVFYRSRASVLYDRVDTLQHGEGALNKIFKNGQVTVMTAGSSKPDLVLRDLPDHQAFYRVLRNHYGQG